MSLISYCSKIWGSANKTQMDRVQKLQNFAGRVALGGVRKRDHITPILKELNWLKVRVQCTYDLCIYIYKIRNNLLPDWLESMPTIAEVNNNSFNTRQSHLLFIPRTNTDSGARAIVVRGPVEWNKLPESIKNCHSVSSFKHQLHIFLKNR